MSNERIIATARVTYVLRGYGDLTLTESALYWNKSATSFLAFGAMNAMTSSHIYLSFADISQIGTYTYFPGGGLMVIDNRGEVYKFSFKRKKDFNVIFSYLSTRLRGCLK